MSDAQKGGRTVRLGRGGEFDLIRGFLAGAAPLPQAVRVGPGDDAAVLDGGWVLSTDLSVEDVHFRRAWLSDHEVGYRAASAALSDLAAMAARPVGVLLSLAAPRNGSVDLAAVSAGAREAAQAVGAAVIGGDVSRSPGPLVVDATVVGCTAWPVLRAGARVGDEVWVTGELGAASAAVRLWDKGEEPPPELRSAFARPTPRVDEAACLSERKAPSALIDISDGLAGDAGHLAAAGGVRVVLQAEAIPVSPGAWAALGPDDSLDAALHGGEDYELCFTAPPGRVDTEAFAERFAVSLTRVGRVEEGEGVALEREGEITRLERGGFSHVEEGG